MSRLAQWFADETANLPELRPSGWAVMGFPIWGAAYWDRFERFCLASMRAPENYAALARHAALVVWTRESGRDVLQNLMAPYDIEVVVRTIPAELLSANKYQVLAVVERLLIRTAAKNGRGYTGVFPDFIQSEGYFANLRFLSRHHDAIALANLTATAGAPLVEDLKAFQRGPEAIIVVPARELGDIGWRHLHAVKRAEVRDEKRLPASHLLVWRGLDYARIHSAHCNAAWMSPELCRKAPRDDANAVAGFTLDSAIPFFLGSRPYHPLLEDELVIVDLYDQDLPVRPMIPLNRWRQVFDMATFGKAASYAPFFREPSMVPLRRCDDGLSDGEIERQVSAVLREIEPTKVAR